MQSEMLGLMDITKVTEATQKPYGLDDAVTEDFGRKCLMPLVSSIFVGIMIEVVV